MISPELINWFCKWILFEKENNTYPLKFSEIGNLKIKSLQSNNIRIIEEKIIDKELSAFIFKDNENGEFKGGINLNGKSYYIGQVSMVNTPEDLMGIEEIASAYTPVPGGVGPMTITTLIRQTVEAAEKALG